MMHKHQAIVQGETDSEEIARCQALLLSALQRQGASGNGSFPEGKVAGFVVGAGSAARTAIPALNKLGVSPIFVLNRDSVEMYAIINEFQKMDLQGLRTPGMAERELEDLLHKAIQLGIGVGCIPNTPPTAPREEYVYKIAEILFRQPYSSQGDGSGNNPGELGLPQNPCLVDLVNQPSGLLMKDMAENYGWAVSSKVQ